MKLVIASHDPPEELEGFLEEVGDGKAASEELTMSEGNFVSICNGLLTSLKARD